jgi:asparagine synthase (glutamine-hydrolysing)
MPGICGLVATRPTADLTGTLAEMVRRLAHHPWYVTEQHAEAAAGLAVGRVSLGFVNTAPQPAANEDRSLLAVMDGEVYDAAEQRRRLAAAGHRFRTDSQAELLLHGYEQEGQAFFRGLHGKFTAAIWDAGRRRLILVNDRFGMKPLYYAALPGRLLLGSEIKALLVDPDVSRRPNLRGVAQFFTYGQLLGDETLLEGVHLLPAAGWLTYDARDGRVALERYWRPEPHAGTNSRTPREILDRVDDAFGRAVERCTADADGLGLSLSGGLDSRTILAACDRGRPLSTVSVGVEGSMDHASAADMAWLAGRPHHRCLLDDRFLDRFEDHLRRMVRLTDGQYLSQCIVMPTLPVYRELGIRVLLRGHAGELMHMTKAYNFSLDREALGLDEAGLEAWLFRRLQAYMLDGTDGRLFAPAFRGQMEALARDSLRACLRETAGAEPPVQCVWQLFLSMRLRRETALSLVKFGSVVETRLPYLDNELVDALLAAPPEMKLGEQMQAHILRRRLPAFLDVVNVNTGTRVGAGRLARAVGTFRKKVLGKLGVRGYQHYEQLGLWLRRELRPLVSRLLLSERCLRRGVFDPDTVRQVVQGHFAGKNHTFLLLALMIFEVGQRELIDDADADAPEREARSLAAAGI